MEHTEEKLRRVNGYRGVVIDATVDIVRLPDGKISCREVVQHPGGACVLPVDGQGLAWCVRQYRYPMGEEILEAPAGKLEPGEDPLACAVRELGEETGCTAGRMVPLGCYYTSPGYSTERLYLYLALDLRAGDAHLDEGEFLDVVRIPFRELYDRVARGEVPDAKTAIAVFQADHILRDPEEKGI